jgi:hypothetical protein
MLHELYARWMYRWETELTTRDENRIVRPLEWGFDWLKDWTDATNIAAAAPALARAESLAARTTAAQQATQHAATAVLTAPEVSQSITPEISEAAMLAINAAILADSDRFFGYTAPSDYRLEQRHPELFPTNVRPETLAQAAALKAAAQEGKLPKAEFLRFTSPVRTPYPENDLVNARWYPAPPDKQSGTQSRKAIIVMPQWNADAFSHNALCSMFNRFGVSALRLSKPYHDIRRPAELERSDYAVSSNIGRTLAACQQAVVDIRCCLDWLEAQGYTQFGVLGTSLGSCYAFLAAAHDPRLEVCAFNHASTSFGDVVWTGQSTRHIRAAFEQAGLTQPRLNALWGAISPVHYMERFRDTAARRSRRTLVVHATYDLTFLEQFSIEVLRSFDALGIAYESKVLPCGHYTTGETPYKFLDGWYLGSFIYQAFKSL